MLENWPFIRFKPRFRLCVPIALLGLVLILSSCGSIEQDITVYRNEKWKAETRIGLKPQELAMIGESEIIDRLERQQRAAQAQGVDFEWNRKNGEDNRVYFVVKASGSGYELLNQIVFDGDASFQPIIIDDREAVRFQYTSSYELARYSLSISTGEVLESTGVQSANGKVSWNSPGQTMQAVLLPKSSSNSLLIVGAALVFFVLIIIAFATAKRRRQEGFAAAISTNYCHRCGGELPLSGQFCPHCGSPRL